MSALVCACGNALPSVGRFSRCMSCLLAHPKAEVRRGPQPYRLRIESAFGIPTSAKPAKPPRRPKGSTPEGLVLRSVLAALEKLPGVTIWRNSSGMTRSAGGGWITYGVGGKGAADLVGYLHGSGRSVYLEVKAPEGRIAPHQSAWLEQRRSEGCVAAVVRSAIEAVRTVQEAQAGR